MKNSEIKSLSVAELKDKIVSEREGLRKLQFAHKISSIENPMRISQSRKLIARLNTELKVKESSAK
jgi:large subunit ribosomal protein L29